jgi:hypothetical protein
MANLPKAVGVSVAAAKDRREVAVFFERPLTDDELRALHDLLAGRATCSRCRHAKPYGQWSRSNYCGHPNNTDSDPTSHRGPRAEGEEGMGYSYDEGGEILVSGGFGCILWEAK